jgi:hypothetical protein
VRRYTADTYRRGRAAAREARSFRPAAPLTEAEEAQRFQDAAPRVGFCGACGTRVNEPAGVLHAGDCPYLPAERRRAS